MNTAVPTSWKETPGNGRRHVKTQQETVSGAMLTTEETRRAQLLVPVEHMAQVHNLFSEHKECISTFNQREADFTNLIQEASPPHAIYVPTVAVHNNLALIQQRSASSVWENAPASVRSPAGTPSSGYRPPTLPTNLLPKPPLLPNAISQLLQSPPARSAQAEGTPKKDTQQSHGPNSGARSDR
ncbi:hypothetical protein MHU86_15091 [Fragilaria crotonensis]|nr:hypothetical protein MHU86_15091 [Fragilaria crotonensis]